MRHLLILAMLCVVVLAGVAVFVPDIWRMKPKPPSDGPTIGQLETRANNLQRQIEIMEQTADRKPQWKTCVSLVPVNEVGDEDNLSGYNYEERDGIRQTFMSTLVVEREDERPEYAFLKFARREGCESQPTDPNGTGEDARIGGPDTIQTGARLRPSHSLPKPARRAGCLRWSGR